MTVCCATADPGPQVRAILETVRDVADEIIVAADARTDDDARREYAAVADRVFEFEFRQPIERVFPWLHAQCSGDWILRLDTDEVPSAALVEALPSLTEADDIVQYWLPRHWLFPDVQHWLFEWPWWPDFQNRLVRNDGLLWMTGLSQTMNEPELPARYLEYPLYHLDAAVRSKTDRRAKVERYLAVDPSLRERVGDRLLNAYYLPEDHAASKAARVPDHDQRVINAVLEACPAPAQHPPDVRPASNAEIDRHWPPRTVAPQDYKATITLIDGYRELIAGEHRPFRVAVRNDGGDTWPGGENRRPLIRLGYRWTHSQVEGAPVDTPRGAFPGPVPPGTESIVPLPIVAPDQPGVYTMEIDVVHEFVRWFGSPVELEIAVVPAHEPKPESAEDGGPPCAITLLENFNWMFTGFVTRYWVQVRNVGTESWPGNDQELPFRLGYRWRRPDGLLVTADGHRTNFPTALPPGQEQIVAMHIQAPETPGEYLLELDVVHEFVGWLGVGKEVVISVRPDAMAPQAPPRETLGPALASMDRQFVDRLGRLCGLGRDDVWRLFEPGVEHSLTIPALGGRSVVVRGGTSDLGVLDVVFDGAYHLPPAYVSSPRVIVDLGANIGLTMAHYASLFPQARVIGVELDSANAELCRRNVSPWADRCTVVHGALWPDDAELVYTRREGAEWAYRVGDVSEGEHMRVRGISLATLLRTYLSDADVDFLKIDIEGAEREILRGPAEWADRVRAIKVETHAPYTPAQCASDLARLGFSSRSTGEHFDTTVEAWRPEKGEAVTIEPRPRRETAAAVRAERDKAIQEKRVLRGELEAQRQRIAELEQVARDAHQAAVDADATIEALRNMKVMRWSAPLRRMLHRVRARRR